AKGEVIQAGMLERNDAHKLIEECMIAANVEAARFVIRKKIPAPFRIHDRPPERKYTELLEFLMEFGLRLPPWQKVEPKDFTTLLRKVRKRPDAALLETVLLRSQSLAQYSIENIGHFGLALESYGHFTSPIRRYPDLLLHRSIKHILNGGSASDFSYTEKEMGTLCLACSEKERRADEAEREVDERYRSAWMEQHVGSDFDGVVSGVTSFGLFVELIESKVNGLVHVTMLPHDYYHFDATRKTLAGERRGLAWSLGDTVRVKVLRASVEDRRIDFKLVLPDEIDTPRKGGTPTARPHPNAKAPRGAAKAGLGKPAGKGGAPKSKAGKSRR
ncbi:MAG: RNB domain-containing ribonuclease, partial [Silanimonas sp.]